MRTLVLGDIHGAAKALEQVLARAKFDREHDRLISLGDVSDGWPDTLACVEILLSAQHLVAIRGNHDLWTLQWMETGEAPYAWLVQGGRATTESYRQANAQTMDRHRKFFRDQVLTYVQEDRLFLHADFDLSQPLEKQSENTLLWTRRLVEDFALRREFRLPYPTLPYREIYLGHTPTFKLGVKGVHLQMGQLWAMDSGVKHGHPLTLMDIDTKQSWQSDPVSALYDADDL